jgi:putative endonuclease
MKTLNRKTGMLAENIASEALIKKGFQILERNFANRFGEIDIIAKDPSAGSGQDVLVFVEVKAKKGIKFGTPEEMITAYKLKRIQRMATIYMASFARSDLAKLACRIDVVAIVFAPDNKVISLTHYENVYS